MDTHVDGHVPRPGESTTFLANVVSAGYFDLMRIPIKRGRPIDASDRRGTQAVAVVNEAFARRFWGTSDPVGRHIRIYEVDINVVGIAGDGKYAFLAPLDEPSPPFVYLPFAQWGHYEAVLHVRADGDPMALVPSIARVVTGVDGRLTAMSPVDARGLHGGAVPADPAGEPWCCPCSAAPRWGSPRSGSTPSPRMPSRSSGGRSGSGWPSAPRRRGSWRVSSAHAARYVGTGAVAGAALSVAMVYGLATQAPGHPATRADRAGGAVCGRRGRARRVAALAVIVPAGRAARVNPTTALRDE